MSWADDGREEPYFLAHLKCARRVRIVIFSRQPQFSFNVVVCPLICLLEMLLMRANIFAL